MNRDTARIAELARALARRHLGQARVNRVPVPGSARDLLVDRQAARILRGVAADIEAQTDLRADADD